MGKDKLSEILQKDIDGYLENIGELNEREKMVQYYIDLTHYLRGYIGNNSMDLDNLDKQLVGLGQMRDSFRTTKTKLGEVITYLHGWSDRNTEESSLLETIAQKKGLSVEELFSERVNSSLKEIRKSKDRLLQSSRDRELLELKIKGDIENLRGKGYYPDEILDYALKEPEVMVFFNLEVIRQKYHVPEEFPYELATGRLFQRLKD